MNKLRRIYFDNLYEKKRQGTHKPCLLTPTKLICIGDFTVANTRTNELLIVNLMIQK